MQTSEGQKSFPDCAAWGLVTSLGHGNGLHRVGEEERGLKGHSTPRNPQRPESEPFSASIPLGKSPPGIYEDDVTQSRH